MVLLLPKLNRTLNELRKRGVHIIHRYFADQVIVTAYLTLEDSPSNVVEYYRGSPPREKARMFAKTVIPTEPMGIDEKREV